MVCPNDPTIPLYAKGYAGRQLFVEMDAAGWFGDIPEYVIEEITSVDYVIQVNKVVGFQFLPNSRLESLGFRPVEYNELKGSAYRIWSSKH
ncbi:MAG: hypothetical protein H7Z75_08345 [Ferruginibacter sp.]|nr:hypothetical protein [Cytophagales bacterium]